MSTEPFDVSLRSLQIPTDAGVIAGICLSYRAEQGARSFFDFVHQYLSAPGPMPRRLVEVKATSESAESYSVTLEVGLGSTLRRIEIGDVAREHIDSIRTSLRSFAYYLLAAGYDLPNGQVALLPLSGNHLFLNRIIIDNVQYTGHPDQETPWHQLVQAEYVVYQPDE